MKKIKKILSVLLAVVMILTIIPGDCFATSIPSQKPTEGHAGFYGDASGWCTEIAYDTYYKCLGTSITTTDADAENYNLYFDSDNQKLIFNDFVSSGYLLVPTGITIEFQGENSMTKSSASIEVYDVEDGDITICGDGSLDANCGFEFLNNLKGNVKIGGNVTLNFTSSGVSTHDGSITICDNAEVNVIPPSSTNGFALYAGKNSEDTSGDLIITGNAKVTVQNSSITAKGKLEIGGDAVVDVACKLYAGEISIVDNAQVKAAGMCCFAGNITIDSTQKTTLTDGIDLGTSYNTDTYELKIHSDLEVTATGTYSCGIGSYVGNVVIGNEDRSIKVDIISDYLGIYLATTTLDVYNAEVNIEGQHAVYCYGEDCSVSISNSTVTVNGSYRAFNQGPELTDYEKGYRVMAGTSDTEAEIVDVSENTGYYTNMYVKIEPMPEYTLNLTAPSKTVYTTGEELDITGGALQVVYADEVTQDITLTKDMITGYDENADGKQTLTVTYGDKTAQFDVTVIDLSKTYTTNLNSNGMTNDDFVIRANEGYLISDSEDGEFEETLSVSEGTDTYSFYVKHTDSDTVLGPVSVGYEIDKDAPVIGNIEDGATYYTTQTVTVEDKNLDSVTVNGETVEGDVILAGNTDATYTITAKDKVGNETTVTVTMKPIASLTEDIKDITEENVNVDALDAIEQVKENLSNLATEDEAEQEEINKAIENCEKLAERVEEVQNAVSTETVDRAENITGDNVVLTDKETLEQAKEELEKALEEYGGNYTDAEKQDIQDKITQIDEALEIISRVENVIEKIDSLPDADAVTTGDAEAANEAKAALDELSDYEKALVDTEMTAKLDSVLQKIEVLSQETTTIPEETTTPKETTTPEETTTTKAETATNAFIPSASKTNTVTKGKISISWKKVKGVDGYDIFLRKCGKKITKKNIVKSVKSSKTSVTISKIGGKKLKADKTYKIRVRAYKLVNGKKQYVASTLTYHVVVANNKKYTNTKKIKLSFKKVTLKVNETKKIQATAVKADRKKKNLSKKHGNLLRYKSSDKTVATVNKKGKITARGKGTCYIYVTALNGVQKKVKVTVE